MTENTEQGAAAEIVEASGSCTLEELCHACNVNAQWIAELVEHGVIEPTVSSSLHWQFDRVVMVRVAKAKRMERDLDLNAPGIALALDLLDEIDDLRARLRAVQAYTLE